MTPLCEIATKHHTDKAPWGWNYTPIYFEWLSEYRQSIKNVLEIGVWRGASLRTWADFFPNAMIYGVENDPGCQVVGESRIETFCCDAFDASAMNGVMSKIGPVDFFIDDAVHFLDQQSKLLQLAWPHIAAGGVYAIEEVRHSEREALMRAVMALPLLDRVEMDFRGYQGDYWLAIMRKRQQ